MNALILDYGTGNIKSLRQLLLCFFDDVKFSRSPFDVSQTDLLVLPGVGSAVTASTSLKDSELKSTLINRYEKNMPIVGICLGAQLMTNYLDESQTHGLKFIGGNASIIEQKKSHSYNIGWRSLDFDQLISVGLSKDLTAFSLASFQRLFASLGFLLCNQFVLFCSRKFQPQSRCLLF